MRGYLETLTMTEMQLDATTRARYLNIVADETSRLERLIGDLLDLARLEGGGGTLAVESIAVEQLFARVSARHERACTDARVTMTTTIEPGAEIVRGDRDRLEQALQNLAANALRYAPGGSEIELRARPVDGGVALTVSDQGPGIAAEHLPHVFDRFYKAEESRVTQHGGASLSHGSGLGLSIVKAIVERHGGQITVRSQPGRTVFELVVPA
jgi:signal transduction histidine kinase